jgi:hypothetical protein
MAFLRILLIGILIYLTLKVIGRLLFPWVYITGNNKKDSGQDSESWQNKKEGDVTVEDNRRDKNKIIRKDEGEYIDYEEIK